MSELEAQEPSSILIREIHAKDDPAFLDAMELYVESFPRDEREPVRSFARRCDPLSPRHRERTNRTHLLVAESGGQVIAMRSCAFDPEGGWGYFVYIVVDRAFRRTGIGSRLLDYSKSLLRLDATATASELKAVFFECERICDAKTSEQTLERRSRLDYFARKSGTVVSGTYVQPAAREGLEPLPLNLMAYRLSDGLDRSDMVRGFYKGFMGIDGNNTLLAEALRGTSDEEPR